MTSRAGDQRDVQYLGPVRDRRCAWRRLQAGPGAYGSRNAAQPDVGGRGLSGSGYWSASGRVCPHPCFSVLYIRLLPFVLHHLSLPRPALLFLSRRTQPLLPAARTSSPMALILPLLGAALCRVLIA